MKKHLFRIIFYLLLFAVPAAAQSYKITGTVTDAARIPLIGASVVVHPSDDSLHKKGVVTDIDGHFMLEGLEEGHYQLRISYISFRPHSRPLQIGPDVSLGTIILEAEGNMLENVTVKTQQIRVEQSGDTTSFNAAAYKTNPDATAEDLLRKMPGMTKEGGTIKAGGEEVKRVLVDGKPFFGDDPNATLSNLPAEIIDKIQVFDQLSDQAQLTGFDDGQAQKTINIVTKPGKNNGQFGKVYAGYGTTDKNFSEGLYSAGGNINFFKGDRRISLIGLSNNINQQNFSSDDLMGLTGSSGGNRGGQRGGGGNTGNFLVGQQNGITQTHSVGLNYSDYWGKKIKVSGSYFFNTTENTNRNNLTRTYFTGSPTDLTYAENSLTIARNTNHRVNLRMEYTIDSSNTIIFTPRISLQQYENDRNLFGEGSLGAGNGMTRTENYTFSKNNGVNLDGNIVYRYKFRKKGRTASLNFNSRYNDREGSGGLYALNELADSDTTLLDQQYHLNSDGITYSGSLNYTEPIREKGQLMLQYSTSVNTSHSEKITNNDNGLGGGYTDMDTLLSNKYKNTYTTQKGSVSYRYNDQKISYTIGLGIQHASLDGTQHFPYTFNLERSFQDILPDAMLNYKFSRTENLRIMYRTRTNAPSISQLQHVIDNSNPLLLKTGNPELKQHYEHTLIIRYGKTNPENARSFNAFVYGNYTDHYIGTQTIIPVTDTQIINGVPIPPGVQISRPVNLNGYYNFRSFLSYGTPLKILKSNLNFNGGVQYSRRPGIVQEMTNYAHTYGLNGGIVISSNISENTDFTLSWSGNYNIVKNTAQRQSDNNYYNQVTSLQFNQIFAGRWLFNTSVNHSLYTGLSQGYDQQFLLWNASVGYKFLKDRSLDLRLTAFDLLNQNRAIQRTVNESYIEDNFTNVLRRYVMLQLTYTLRKFGGQKGAEQEEAMMPPPPGIPGRPGGHERPPVRPD